MLAITASLLGAGLARRISAKRVWWFAFTRDLRRERSFTIDDMPLEAGPYGGLPKSTLSGNSVP